MAQQKLQSFWGTPEHLDAAAIRQRAVRAATAVAAATARLCSTSSDGGGLGCAGVDAAEKQLNTAAATARLPPVALPYNH